MKKGAILIVCILVMSSIPSLGSIQPRKPDLITMKPNAVKDIENDRTTVFVTVKNKDTASTGQGFHVRIRVSTPGVGQGANNLSQNVWCHTLAPGGQAVVSAIFQGTHWKNFEGYA